MFYKQGDPPLDKEEQPMSDNDDERDSQQDTQERGESEGTPEERRSGVQGAGTG